MKELQKQIMQALAERFAIRHWNRKQANVVIQSGLMEESTLPNWI